MDNNYHPLVSVFVVTYNAADYIYETLDSIKAQTYDNIELIVSDDHSSDETVPLANEWIEKNKERFVRTEVITVDHNTGVSANYNRAVSVCMGEWVKNVDGDDLITPNCINDNLAYVKEHPEIDVLFSDMLVFREKPENVISKFSDTDFKGFFELTAQEQFKRLIQRNFLPSTPLFIKCSVLKQYPYNEHYIGLEDFPMWFTLTRNGHRAYYHDKITAMYRKGDSVTASKRRLFSPVYMDSMEMFYWDELYHYLKQNDFKEANNYYLKQFMLYQIAMVVFKNKGRFVYRGLFSVLRKMLNCE